MAPVKLTTVPTTSEPSVTGLRTVSVSAPVFRSAGGDQSGGSILNGHLVIHLQEQFPGIPAGFVETDRSDLIEQQQGQSNTQTGNTQGPKGGGESRNKGTDVSYQTTPDTSGIRDNIGGQNTGEHVEKKSREETDSRGPRLVRGQMYQHRTNTQDPRLRR